MCPISKITKMATSLHPYIDTQTLVIANPNIWDHVLVQYIVMYIGHYKRINITYLKFSS